jgi:hypothetical protein
MDLDLQGNKLGEGFHRSLYFSNAIHRPIEFDYCNPSPKYLERLERQSEKGITGLSDQLSKC